MIVDMDAYLKRLNLTDAMIDKIIENGDARKHIPAVKELMDKLSQKLAAYNKQAHQ